MAWKFFRKSVRKSVGKSDSRPDTSPEPTGDVSLPPEGDDASGAPRLGEGLRTRLLTLLVDFSGWFQIKAQPMLRKFDWTLLRNSALILAGCFILASSVSTFAAHLAMNTVTSPAAAKRAAAGSPDIKAPMEAQTVSKEGASPSELRKAILERNVFNAQGALAPEEIAGGLTKTKDLDFESVPCSTEQVPIEITGTIFTGDPKKSFVTAKDPKIADADIYKHGDVIIEHEEYEVHKVNRGSVEFRKGDQKICVVLKGFEGAPGATQQASAGSAGAVRPENIEQLEFDSNYISQEIGPGYANILNSAKLIPDVDGSGKVQGFKIIAITPGSLFDRMKLQNGDVIADVNGVSLRDASQGFKLYQSLQEEREISVGIIRGGEAMTRKVRVK